MVSIPLLIPVTIPPDTEAEELLRLQLPPVVVSVRVTEDPAQTTPGPDIEPALSERPIVTICLALAVPHVLVTV
jgi:hypothetical protein